MTDCKYQSGLRCPNRSYAKSGRKRWLSVRRRTAILEAGVKCSSREHQWCLEGALLGRRGPGVGGWIRGCVGGAVAEEGKLNRRGEHDASLTSHPAQRTTLEHEGNA